MGASPSEPIVPDAEWTHEKRQRMLELEMEPRMIRPTSYTMQHELRDRVQRGELRDDTVESADAEMDPE